MMGKKIYGYIVERKNGDCETIVTATREEAIAMAKENWERFTASEKKGNRIVAGLISESESLDSIDVFWDSNLIDEYEKAEAYTVSCDENNGFIVWSKGEDKKTIEELKAEGFEVLKGIEKDFCKAFEEDYFNCVFLASKSFFVDLEIADRSANWRCEK